MSVAQARPGQARTLPGGSRIAALGYAGLAALVSWWAWRAFHNPRTLDTGLAYDAGKIAWATGRPEVLITWNGMPFLVAVMALLGRVASGRAVADLVTALNVALPVGAAGLALHRVRPRLSPAGWWIAAFALAAFGPLMSSVWWKQFNVIVLVLALAGFELMRRGRTHSAALAIGLSVSIKPLAFLLPFVLLARRETRRVGALALLWIAGLDIAAQGLLAWRAHDIARLNPYLGFHNLVHKTTAAPNIYLCHPLNFAPGSALCRLVGGFDHWTLQRIAVWCFVALLGLWIIDVLRGRSGTSWEVLAFTLPLSVMLSSLAWSHYQIMLAPLFFLLFVRFATEGASFGPWAGLLLAFVLASLMWEPYGTIVSSIRGKPASPLQPTFLEEFAQFSQYVLVLAGILWYAERRASTRSWNGATRRAAPDLVSERP
jgi:Glycosyltransferase family 87